jgi:DNA-binding NtrC family response regulator
MTNNIERLAATDNTLLITGRTGTGKTHLARRIHSMSPRRAGKFVAVNLATLSENLIESELFGHERGAFSGADCRRMGKLEAASGGTVFLDEIGELSPRLQTKLLEALNSFTISPVGSNREIPLNIRIITATNRNLSEMVAKGEFREDLFFRVNTFQIHLPGLAGDHERIERMAEQFAREAARSQNRPFSCLAECFRERLRSHSWPGNVRELKNAMEFAVAMSSDPVLRESALPPFVNQARHEPLAERAPAFPTDYREAKTLFERTYLEEILGRFEGRINLTAKRSGLSKVTLIDKIRRYEIDIPTIKYRAHLASAGRGAL